MCSARCRDALVAGIRLGRLGRFLRGPVEFEVRVRATGTRMAAHRAARGRPASRHRAAGADCRGVSSELNQAVARVASATSSDGRAILEIEAAIRGLAVGKRQSCSLGAFETAYPGDAKSTRLREVLASTRASAIAGSDSPSWRPRARSAIRRGCSSSSARSLPELDARGPAGSSQSEVAQWFLTLDVPPPSGRQDPGRGRGARRAVRTVVRDHRRGRQRHGGFAHLATKRGLVSSLCSAVHRRGGRPAPIACDLRVQAAAASIPPPGETILSRMIGSLAPNLDLNGTIKCEAPKLPGGSSFRSLTRAWLSAKEE